MVGEDGWGRGKWWGENGDNCIRTTIKKMIKKEEEEHDKRQCFKKVNQTEICRTMGRRIRAWRQRMS